MSPRPIPISLAWILCASLPAQTVRGTIPRDYLDQEGGAGLHAGWRYTPARSLNLYPGRALPAALKTIRGLVVRPDGRAFQAMKGKTAVMEAALSNKGVISRNLYLTDWARHLGKDRKVVMKRRSVSFPAAGVVKPPQPWSRGIRLPFDAPWIRSGSSTEALCIDLKIWTTTWLNSYWIADATYFDHFGSIEDRGTSCREGFRLLATGAHVGSVPGFSTYGYSGAGGDLVLSFLGTRPLALPLPGTGCYLYGDIALLHPAVRRSVGSRGSFPRFVWGGILPAQAGATVYVQAAAIPSKGPLLLSHGLRVTFGPGAGGFPDQGTIYGTGKSPLFDPDRSKATGWTYAACIFGWY